MVVVAKMSEETTMLGKKGKEEVQVGAKVVTGVWERALGVGRGVEMEWLGLFRTLLLSSSVSLLRSCPGQQGKWTEHSGTDVISWQFFLSLLCCVPWMREIKFTGTQPFDLLAWSLVIDERAGIVRLADRFRADSRRVSTTGRQEILFSESEPGHSS